MAQAEVKKEGFGERTAEFFKRLHKFLGAAAVVGAVILNSEALALVAVWEFLHIPVWNWIKKKLAKNKQRKAAIGEAALAGT